MSGFLQSFRRLAPVRSLFIAAALCMAGQVNAAAPDLTAGGVPTDSGYSGGGVGIDALSGPAGCLMAPPMLRTYAMPLCQAYLIGKNQNTANCITPKVEFAT